jgi:hypothetical protein
LRHDHSASGPPLVGPTPPAPSAPDIGELERLGALPRELGVLFLAVGVAGVLLPGPVGAPFLVIGSMVLWPRLFERVEGTIHRRFPGLHHLGVAQVRRFLDDLERRYPTRAPLGHP